MHMFFLHLPTKNFIKLLLVGVFVGIAPGAYAASLNVTPATGVYGVGVPFTVSIKVNTSGSSVNAADGQLTFNPKELQVVGVSRAGSVFNLWVGEPAFSNSAGTISFSGGSTPPGYSGSGGTVMTATLRALGAGTPKLQFKSGSILANDGQGTNILTAMNGGSFTISAPADTPAPEYIPPANTPKAPVILSTTNPDPQAWYKNTTAELSWKLPADVTAVRTLLDTSDGSVPTKVYDSPITEKSITDLPQGVSYFHIQFKNAEGWGRITHYRLAIDSDAPRSFSIIDDVSTSTETTTHKLLFVVDDISPMREFKVQMDGGEPVSTPGGESATTTYSLPVLTPGYHTMSVEAVDSAGNSLIATHSFTVSAFEKPEFTEYPNRINTEVIPAISGLTRPNAEVFVEIVRTDTGAVVQALPQDMQSAQPSLTANDLGIFTYIPNAPFAQGVYELRAVARDDKGNISEASLPIRIIVEVPGYVAFGTALITVLSVLIPLVALLLLLGFGSWFLWHRMALWRRRVQKETKEAEDQLAQEFSAILTDLNTHVDALKISRKNKLTKAESDLISALENDLRAAEGRIAKEIVDIEKTFR